MIINQATRFWTFNSLAGAFLDLFIAYFLLCGSTIALFASKFLGLFGFNFPTPNNNGFFGIPNSDIRELLVDYPTEKISAVQFSVARKFPFDSIFFKAQNWNANHGLNLGMKSDESRELEGGASCSSKSDARKGVMNETPDSGIKIEKEKGFDMKGKVAVNHRVKGTFRRRKKGSFGHGKHSSVSSSPNWVTCVDQLSNDKESSRGIEDGSTISGANSRNHDAETPTVVKSDINDNQDTGFNEPDTPNEADERVFLNDDDKYNAIVLLTRELEDEQAARAALCIELEKERNAAATAADEAMAMILRLQEEKASIEMESRQYQRMIEEKSAYDAEEMNILKEIVLRREREKHFLEKEVEMYRQMLNLENDQLYSDTIQDFSDDPNIENIPQLGVNKQLPEKTIAIVGEEQDSSGEASYGNKEPKGETDLHVYDVHVIDNGCKSDGNRKQESFLRRLDKEADKSRRGSAIGLPPLNSSSLRRNSTSILDNERTKLETEVEFLRERLRVVQEGREKLNLSVDNREKESVQLQLLEDIAHQLQEIRMLTEPRKPRQGSLPLPSFKGSTKKRRCRSASLGPARSS